MHQCCTVYLEQCHSRTNHCQTTGVYLRSISAKAVVTLQVTTCTRHTIFGVICLLVVSCWLDLDLCKQLCMVYTHCRLSYISRWLVPFIAFLHWKRCGSPSATSAEYISGSSSSSGISCGNTSSSNNITGSLNSVMHVTVTAQRPCQQQGIFAIPKSPKTQLHTMMIYNLLLHGNLG